MEQPLSDEDERMLIKKKGHKPSRVTPATVFMLLLGERAYGDQVVCTWTLGTEWNFSYWEIPRAGSGG